MTLTDDNFILYAMHNYDNIQCTDIEEFNDDLLRFKYLNKLFSRYMNREVLNERLVLNHIIVLYNVFGNALNDMIFFKIEKPYWNILATFLVYLNRLPDAVISQFTLDQHVVNVLRKL